MRMQWIRHNPVGKEKLSTEKIFGGQLDFANIYHYRKNTKQLINEIKENKRNQTCHICHSNVRKVEYLISYLASCFQCVKHVQNLSLKNSKTQELVCT